jgi:hypothetical protein
MNQGSVGAFLEKKKKGKEQGKTEQEDKKRGKRKYLGQARKQKDHLK